MSRIGKVPIKIPEGVKIHLDKYTLMVSKDGKKLQQEIHPDFLVEIDETEKLVTMKRPSNSKMHRSMHGLYRALLNNMIIGVTNGFDRKLEIVGIGYRGEMKGKSLKLSLGYSHPILFKPPAEVEISLETPTVIRIRGIDKQLVGQVAAKIRSFRPPEPYKGKGIKYAEEHVRRKAGKTGT